MTLRSQACRCFGLLINTHPQSSMMLRSTFAWSDHVLAVRRSILHNTALFYFCSRQLNHDQNAGVIAVDLSQVQLHSSQRPPASAPGCNGYPSRHHAQYRSVCYCSSQRNHGQHAGVIVASYANHSHTERHQLPSAIGISTSTCRARGRGSQKSSC